MCTIHRSMLSVLRDNTRALANGWYRTGDLGKIQKHMLRAGAAA
ncbi:hypothetical protein [Cupriavidus sp. UYPR2.512]|nr:hypothetical protein [Cupriavidus sp. UYPR2.512]